MHNGHGSDPDASVPIGILDFLFTFAVTLGLAPNWVGIPWSDGMLLEPWIIQGRLPVGSEISRFLTFLIGFLTLTFSWYGYHIAVKRKGFWEWRAEAILRFTIDVGLVVIYGLMLLHFTSLSTVLQLLILVHLLFLIWDVLLGLERREQRAAQLSELQSEHGKFGGMTRWISWEVASLVTVVLTLLVYFILLPHSSDVYAAAAAIGVIFLYRMMKIFAGRWSGDPDWRPDYLEDEFDEHEKGS